jgi:hypothetical protein
MGCQRGTPEGRSDLWIRRPFEVPPRVKEAGKLAIMLLVLVVILVEDEARFRLTGDDLNDEGDLEGVSTRP